MELAYPRKIHARQGVMMDSKLTCPAPYEAELDTLDKQVNAALTALAGSWPGWQVDRDGLPLTAAQLREIAVVAVTVAQNDPDPLAVEHALLYPVASGWKPLGLGDGEAMRLAEVALEGAGHLPPAYDAAELIDA